MNEPYRGGTCRHGIYKDTRCFNCNPEATEGIVAVDVLLRVRASEMREWPPEVISRFFAGIAMATDARRQGNRLARAALRPADKPEDEQ